MKEEIQNKVRNVTMAKEKKRFGAFSGNSVVALAQTDQETCGGY